MTGINIEEIEVNNPFDTQENLKSKWNNIVTEQWLTHFFYDFLSTWLPIMMNIYIYVYIYTYIYIVTVNIFSSWLNHNERTISGKIQIEYYATSLLPQLCGLECYRRSKIFALIRVRLHPLHNAKNDTFLLSWQFCITHKNWCVCLSLLFCISL